MSTKNSDSSQSPREHLHGESNIAAGLTSGRKSDSHTTTQGQHRLQARGEHLTEAEVGRLIKAAKNNRWGLRDSAMILIAFRHGLRVSELVHLQWSAIEFESATLHVGRSKGGAEGTHYLAGDEMRVLRALRRESQGAFLFVSERGAPFSPSGFAKLMERVGKAAKMPFKVHPHQLRHACGFSLANRGVDTRTLQAYLGHRSISSTTRYAALAPGRFKNLWL
jgi:type 1 fimbriae regulatory protein FimB/type 1 fimbriae regulatory protein FimE